MIKNDFLLKQIEELIHFLLTLVYPGGHIDEEKDKTTRSALFKKLEELIDKGLYNQAEDYLFDAFDRGEADLQTGVLFYDKLLAIPEKELKAGEFSIKEIQTGLNDYAKLFHIDI
ncbi:MAG: DUF6483 family protein [Peptoniphilus sp.]|nr:DUF6483 family protein [Peptoniphilus sp.]MDD7363100.1 DUF6483 family protein [Bacillota bacterium]MDY6044378.1 DUF6483 family protein [Peptoniphilus sp.]